MRPKATIGRKRCQPSSETKEGFVLEHVFGFGVFAFWFLSTVVPAIFSPRVDLPPSRPLMLVIEFSRFKGSGTFPTMRYNSLVKGAALWFAKNYFKKYHRYPTGKHVVGCTAGNDGKSDIRLPFGGNPMKVGFEINFVAVTTEPESEDRPYCATTSRETVYIRRM